MSLKKFIGEVIEEGKRVRWPKREVLIPSIIVVLVIAIISGAILFGEDMAGKKLIELITSLFK